MPWYNLRFVTATLCTNHLAENALTKVPSSRLSMLLMPHQRLCNDMESSDFNIKNSNSSHAPNMCAVAEIQTWRSSSRCGVFSSCMLGAALDAGHREASGDGVIRRNDIQVRAEGISPAPALAL